MSDRLSLSMSMSDKDALVFRNRAQVFSKDVTTFAIDPLGKIAVLCGYVQPKGALLAVLFELLDPLSIESMQRCAN